VPLLRLALSQTRALANRGLRRARTLPARAPLSVTAPTRGSARRFGRPVRRSCRRAASACPAARRASSTRHRHLYLLRSTRAGSVYYERPGSRVLSSTGYPILRAMRTMHANIRLQTFGDDRDRRPTRSVSGVPLTVRLWRRRPLGLARCPSPRPPTPAPTVVSDTVGRLLCVRERNPGRAWIARRRLVRAAAPVAVSIGGRAGRGLRSE
jgi:hypothetical protein